MIIKTKTIMLEEAAHLRCITQATCENEIIHILLKKLFMSESDEYLFGSPVRFWSNTKIKRVVRLMTIENDLAYVTSSGDDEYIYLKISRNGIDISKQGGWLNYLKCTSHVLAS